MSISDSSIIGIKPTVSPISPEYRSAKKNEKFKRCCICETGPPKTATYPVQGATRIERYRDSFVERQFSRTRSK